jgi:hypothetical protein
MNFAEKRRYLSNSQHIEAPLNNSLPFQLKELTERQSQHARNKALAAGVDVEVDAGKVRPVSPSSAN